jgi:hypothetical protein
MPNAAVSERPVGQATDESIAAELEAYNRAFLELELSWRWDVPTFRDLLRSAADRDCVGAYVERAQPHLLRVYEKSFLRDLVLSAKARYQREC